MPKDILFKIIQTSWFQQSAKVKKSTQTTPHNNNSKTEQIIYEVERVIYR